MDNHGLASDHGFLPSNKLEREIGRAFEGIEDEDGNKSAMLKQDDPDMPVVRPHRTLTGVKGVMNDARNHYALFALQQQADKVRDQERMQRLVGHGTKPAEDGSGDEVSIAFNKKLLKPRLTSPVCSTG